MVGPRVVQHSLRTSSVLKNIAAFQFTIKEQCTFLFGGLQSKVICILHACDEACWLNRTWFASKRWSNADYTREPLGSHTLSLCSHPVFRT